MINPQSFYEIDDGFQDDEVGQFTDKRFVSSCEGLAWLLVRHQGWA